MPLAPWMKNGVLPNSSPFDQGEIRERAADDFFTQPAKATPWTPPLCGASRPHPYRLSIGFAAYCSWIYLNNSFKMCNKAVLGLLDESLLS
jgi:hypothetical protein